MRRALFAIVATTTVSHADTIITTTTTVTIDTSAPAPELAPPGVVPRSESPPPTRDRTFRLAVATGPALGFDTKDKCEEGECIGIHVQVGAAIARHVLVMLGSSLMVRPERPRDDRHHVETLAVQVWPTARWWGELGVGIGSKRSWDYVEPPPRDLSGVDPAGTIAVGFEAIVRPDYSLGIQARVAGTSDLEHTSFGQLLIGVSWY